METILENSSGVTAPTGSPGETSPSMRRQPPGASPAKSGGPPFGPDFTSLFGPDLTGRQGLAYCKIRMIWPLGLAQTGPISGTQIIVFFDLFRAWSLQTAPRGCQEVPRRLQAGLRRLQERSKRLQDGLKSAPRGFKTAPRGLKMPSRGFKSAPRAPREASRRLKGPQDAWRSVPLQG